MTEPVEFKNGGFTGEDIPFQQLAPADLLRLLNEKIIAELTDKFNDAEEMFEMEQDDQSYGEMIALKSALEAVKAILDEAPNQKYHKSAAITSNFMYNYTTLDLAQAAKRMNIAQVLGTYY